ncbi:MlaD family protein [Nocardia crassostreae]|uniref:MlaD family protein n=1 Tax=Nocardia crassostreae TaxID=53428 RepID=UPI000830E843|nr:MlaD family protein [Nocardia crassostreae]
MKRPKLGSVLSLTAIVTVAIVGITYLVFGVAKVRWRDDRISVAMLLADSASLAPRSPVLLSGVRVGQVTAVGNTPDGVRVRFDIDRGRRIPVDSSVTVEALSAMGEPYIEFEPTRAGGPYLTDGQELRTDSIRTPKSIPEIARIVTRLLDQIDPRAVGSLIQTFTQSFSGAEAVLPQLAHASQLLAATVLNRMPQIRRLLINAQLPGSDIAWAGQQLADAGPHWGDFGAKVRQVADAVEVLISARPVPGAYVNGTGLLPFLNELTDYIDRVGPDLQRLYPTLAPLADRAGASLQGVDLSALIAQALNSVTPDGAIRLRVGLK